MHVTWNTPAGSFPAIADIISQQPHTLIAGTTGSGKSVLLHSIIYRLMHRSPADCKLFLLDMKRVSLRKYSRLPHTAFYADNANSCTAAIQQAERIMRKRFQTMQRIGVEQYPGSDIYLIIDEYVDIKYSCGKAAETSLIQIAAAGRAAGVHIILCTQRPTADIITGVIRNNLPAAVGLRTRRKQESINIIGVSGCETLPMYGLCYLDTPAALQPELWRIDMIDPISIESIIDYWKHQKPKYSLF